MILHRQPGEVAHWLVAFYEDISRGWMAPFIPGRFKHVSAFGYQPGARAWLFVDASFDRTRICLLPDGDEAQKMLAQWTMGATVLQIAARPVKERARLVLRPFCCTAVVGSLIGLDRGALRPDALYRQLLRENAEIVHGGPVRPEEAPAGPGARPAAADG